MRRLLFAMLLLAAPLDLAAQEPEFGTAVDEHGHSFVTAFDRQERAIFDLGLDASAGVRGRFTYRTAVAADFPEEEVWWQLRHGLGTLDVDPSRFHLRLVEADYLRHDLSSSILVPLGNEDIRLPGDFDIAVRWNLLGIEAPTDLERIDRWEIIEVDLFLDFLRDPDYRHRLAIGPSADYRIVDGSTHQIVPLSSVRLLYAWENRRGTFAVTAEVHYARVTSLAVDMPPRGSNVFATHGEIEWTPIAINDTPLALVVDTKWRHPGGIEIFAGLRLALQDPK